MVLNPFGDLEESGINTQNSDDDDGIPMSRGIRRKVILDDDDDDDDDDQENEAPQTLVRHKPPRPSVAPPRASILPTKNRNAARRRRSSARFLRLSTAGGVQQQQKSQQQLSQLYQQAIKLNAENRINVSNTWNLALIDNMNEFLEGDEDDNDNVVDKNEKALAPTKNNNKQSTSLSSSSNKNEAPTSRVNFTKASCLMDASVKIFSVRVDDVHLSSYKVLANLHRNDAKGSGDKDDDAGAEDIDDDGENNNASNKRKKNSASVGPTLERNVANLNLNKLDAAFDIDPLFHKMSKTFDEGGAKGLLLANLGVSKQGCNVVFDSSLGEETITVSNTGVVDISSLQSKLDSLLTAEGGSIESMGLVPQLESLREQHEQLTAEGFVEVNAVKSRRYAPDSEQEKEADQSIHQEAIERSQMGGRSFLSTATGRSSTSPEIDVSGPLLDDNDDYAADDFGIGDDGDDDDDDGFDAFLAKDEGARYSDISFSGSAVGGFAMASDAQARGATLLEALTESPHLLSNNDYAFVDNTWAGANLWKKKKADGKKESKPVSKKRTRKATPTLVDLDATDLDLSVLDPPKTRGRRKTSTDPLVWSQATVDKYSANDNLMPIEAEVPKNVLSQLSLRPTLGRGATVATGGTAGDSKKAVGFALDSNDYWDDGGDDDGPGYEFGGGGDDDNEAPFNDDDDSAVPVLDNVRKVQRTRVQYATVAKKVDVKRLKKDLWSTLEERLGCSPEEADTDDDDDDDESSAPPAPSSNQTLSFQEAVSTMETSQGQADVTLPFYFICVLHLANEKGLALQSQGLEDFVISA